LPSRIFELMIGGLLAFFVVNRRSASQGFAIFWFIIGFLLILYSILSLDKSSSFPGLNAITPCLGAMLIIWSGTNQQPIHWILKNRVMVFIGLISYSLYLWHWPIIAYLNYVNINISVAVVVFVVVLSVFLAWLTWKFVEIPMRMTGVSLSFFNVFIRRFAMPVLVVFSMGLAMVYTSGLPKRFSPRVAEFEKAIETKPDVLRNGCHVPTAMYGTPPNDKCRLGIKKVELDGVLIGDSFANHFSGMIDLMAKAEGKSFMDYTMDGCPPIFGFDTGKGAAYSGRCIKRNEAAYSLLTSNRYTHIILASSWPRDEKAGGQLVESIEKILKIGSKLTIILANESIDRASSCPIRRLMSGSVELCQGPRNGYPLYFNEIKSRFPSVHFLDPNRVICRGDFCDPVLDDIPLYRDDVHLNDMGARLVGKYLIDMGEKI